MKLLLTILLALSLTSCGDLTGKSTGANDFLTSNLIGGLNFVKLSDGKSLLEGTMNQSEGHSFKMKFRLPEGKSLRFFFYSNKSLSNGVVATFSRNGGKAFVNLSLNGVTDTREIINQGEVIDLVMDIHNDHSDAHILLWNASGPFGDAEECVDDESCLYNTEYYNFVNDGPWGSQGKAPGTFWGVQGDASLIEKMEGPLGAVSDA